MIGHDILVLDEVENLSVDLDSALFPLNVLLDQFQRVRIGRNIVTAVRLLVPCLRFKQRSSSELDDALHQHVCMTKLVLGVFLEFALDDTAHPSLGDFGPDPVLVVCKPFIRQSFVQQLQKLLHVDAHDLGPLVPIMIPPFA